MSGFESYLAAQYPGARVTQLSASNNTVFLVTGTAGADGTDGVAGAPAGLVAKHVTDSDIPLSYLAESNAALARTIPVQRVRRVLDQERGDPFDGVLADYVPGTDLATVLAEDEKALPAEELSEQLARFLLACRELPRMHDGYGPYKRTAPRVATHTEFVQRYAARYWGRARPLYQDTEIGDAVDDWVNHRLPEALRRNPAPHAVVPIDANLKNFVVTPDGRLVTLNVPIAAVSTPAHAVAAVSAHLRGRALHQVFLDHVLESQCAADAELVPHFELWALLGILSFYAVRHPLERDTWRDWGSPVLLDEDFRSLVGELLLKRAPR
ncbi:hypothetical protein RM844_20420 [Streptomyces sp. DSM 44915]|uniref:Aminoglycoside phosphotransferase domain-containing protein n=1 Tax=Streptomyces chisholmiae TaxID=3075540 RepID=A0ABU2JVT5_9ACTN|nr:hypothetical protein [Streptomyces sp. DSM 44915]MDT0268654.1 hypothetical protein [Streptomyces sp. DSM 44915]